MGFAPCLAAIEVDLLSCRIVAPNPRRHLRGACALRVPTLATVALAALLTACAASPRGDARDDDLSTSETELHTFQRIVPLPVSTTPGDTLYADPIWGIEIVEIFADGRPVAGKPSYVLLDDPNTRPVTVHSSTYIYNLVLSQMLFGKLMPLDYDLVEYDIPDDAASLVIRYRLVRYNSVPDQRVYTLKASRSP